MKLQNYFKIEKKDDGQNNQLQNGNKYKIIGNLILSKPYNKE